ncbi:hypothetical protein KO494_14385 [Lacinutrix sp. C3R15]|uniref:hypothetical protein n=1 Tax=Flavobacteriaceae TaxID=49546 RepID=UPI001C0A330C|nr:MULTISPECIES: hypothetical protein [Flavobacteriaceae]MBU2940733.1 hypothetical protein [Lacinutrix sp. C3R15]MDO6624051.1 hypothetical protein [Oceanihabitans sp. 1_MG-2023]
MKKLIFIFFLFIAVKSFSQNLKLSYTNGTTSSIEGKLKADKYGFYNEIITKDNNNINVNVLTTISKAKKKYVVKKFNANYYAFQSIIENDNISLYKSKNKYYIESNDYQFAEIPFKEKDGYTFSVFDAGILGVYVNKCQATQNYIHDNFYTIRVSDLKKIINTYNSCNLENTSTVSNEAIKEANQPSEVVNFGITVGNSFLNIDYNGMSVDHKQKYSMFNVGAIITFKPNILKRKLNYSFALNYMFSKEASFYASSKNVRTNHGYIETVLGANYLFLKADSKINPYIGIAGGLLFNNGTQVNVRPAVLGASTTIYKGNSDLIYNINAGVLFTALNQKFNFNVAYIPSTKTGLETKNNLESNVKYYNLTGINIRLSYYF